MRFLAFVGLMIFIFYLGVQVGSQDVAEIQQPQQPVIKTEEDIVENNSNDASFFEKHQAVLTQQDDNGSHLYGMAVFLESTIKTFLSMLFQFFYRFTAMFF